MKLTITKSDRGYIVHTEETTCECKSFIDLIQYLGDFFDDSLLNTITDWTKLDFEKPIKNPTPIIDEFKYNMGCTQCGLKFDSGSLNYVCSNHLCPLGLCGPTCN